MNIIRSRWTWWLVKLSRRIWFRAALFAVMSLLSALIAVAIAPFIPAGLAYQFEAGALYRILQILASSMLIVATFSLSTVISAYAAASAGTTPRVTELLLQDPTAQNALSTFVGGFLFALVGIIGLSTDIYGERGHIVLFAMTLLVVSVIVASFLRWVDVLSRFGRVPDAIQRTAKAAADAVAGRVEEPNLGGRPPDEALKLHGRVLPKRMGYVRHIGMAELQEVAEEAGGEILVTAPPGTFLDGAMPIAATTFEMDDERRESIQAAYDVADNRSFDQDPEYGLSAMAEVGIKALSPAINDPVTALRVIDQLVCVLSEWGSVTDGKAPRYDRIYVPALEADDLLDVAFSQLALHGAGDVRVGVRLQEACRSLARLKNPATAAAARRQASRALAHAEAALVLEEDYLRLRSVNESLMSD